MNDLKSYITCDQGFLVKKFSKIISPSASIYHYYNCFPRGILIDLEKEDTISINFDYSHAKENCDYTSNNWWSKSVIVGLGIYTERLFSVEIQQLSSIDDPVKETIKAINRLKSQVSFFKHSPKYINYSLVLHGLEKIFNLK